jgi:hypothetical protein
LRTICSGLCRFLVAMILLSLPAHNVGRKTLISRGSTDRGQARPFIDTNRDGHAGCGYGVALRAQSPGPA